MSDFGRSTAKLGTSGSAPRAGGRGANVRLRAFRDPGAKGANFRYLPPTDVRGRTTQLTCRGRCFDPGLVRRLVRP